MGGGHFVTFGHHLVFVFLVCVLVFFVCYCCGNSDLFFLAAILWQGRHFVFVCFFRYLWCVSVPVLWDHRC